MLPLGRIAEMVKWWYNVERILRWNIATVLLEYIEYMLLHIHLGDSMLGEKITHSVTSSLLSLESRILTFVHPRMDGWMDGNTDAQGDSISSL